MGCNCGSKNQKYNYVYTDGNGRQHTYDNEISARAHKIRDNNKGSIRAVAK